MPLSKTIDQLLGDAIARFERETGINASSPSSPAGWFFRITYGDLAEAWREFEENLLMSDLATAYGEGLDAIAGFFGVYRKRARVGATSSRGVKFSLASPAADDVTIPAGTLVWSTTAPDRYFLTRTATTISQGTRDAFVAIRAPQDGAYYLALPYTLTQHNAGITGLSCTNLESIAGSDDEDDEGLRYRVANARIARSATIAPAIIALLRGVPGVLDVRLLPFRRGTGTYDVVVYTDEPVPSRDMLTVISTYLTQELTAEGIYVTVTGPTITTLDVQVRVGFADGVSSTTRTQAREAAIQAARLYINTLDLGETFYPDRLEHAVMDAANGFVDVAVTSLRVNGVARDPDMVTTTEYGRIIAGQVEVL